MAGLSNIGWTGSTANFWTWRCKHRSPGCFNCYAEKLANKWQGPGAFTSGPPELRRHRLLLPLIDAEFLATDKVFYASMFEPFDPRIPVDDLALGFAVAAVDRRHVWQVLSKLHGVMHSRLTKPSFPGLVRDAADEIMAMLAAPRRLSQVRKDALARAEQALDDWTWPLPNLWLGCSTENQHYADLRLPLLEATPAAVRFISAEPLLSRITLRRYLAWLDWVIAGGESGPIRRDMELAWLTALHDECRDDGVAFFAKQDSGLYPGQRGRIPDENWVHEFPVLAAA